MVMTSKDWEYQVTLTNRQFAIGCEANILDT